MIEPTGCELEATRLIAEHVRGRKGLRPFLTRVRTAMAARQQAGIAKYGHTLEDNGAPLADRLQHLWEELLDAQAYAAWIRRAANPMVPGAQFRAVCMALSVHCTVAILLYQIDKVMQILKEEEAS